MKTIPCRSCGNAAGEANGHAAAPALVSVLDIGETPLANRLLTRAQLTEAEPRFPLELAFCPRCTLLQITESVSPEMMFRDYVYFSSFSDTMLRHSKALAETLIRERKLTGDHLVVEAASNDGYLLQYFAQQGVKVLGIDPARNAAAVARGKGIETIEEFFSRELVGRLRADGIRADVFLANNVLAHVPDPNGFVAGIAELLTPAGCAVIEAPYAIDMIEHSEFDTIYHEHLFYYSLTALNHLFNRHGLTIVDVERIKLHGGSLHLTIMKADVAEPKPSVAALLKFEADWGVESIERYGAFAGQVANLKKDLTGRLAELKRQGKRLAAYGASAKGATLLNHFGIGAETLDFVVDRSTVKQGRFTPGTHLEIRPPEALLEEKLDYLLLLTWNFAEEILGQQAEYRSRGGRFIIPVPEVRIV